MHLTNALVILVSRVCTYVIHLLCVRNQISCMSACPSLFWIGIFPIKATFLLNISTIIECQKGALPTRFSTNRSCEVYFQSIIAVCLGVYRVLPWIQQPRGYCVMNVLYMQSTTSTWLTFKILLLMSLCVLISSLFGRSSSGFEECTAEVTAMRTTMVR